MSSLQKGDSVLITGGTGWIGSHIAYEALAAGLKVRLAVRDVSKAAFIVDALKKEFGGNNVSTILVPDYTIKGAYDEAMAGVQGIVHAATDLTFSDKADDVIPAVLQSYAYLLESAQSNGEIRRIVFTSSGIVVGSANFNEQIQNLDSHSWSEKAAQEYKTNPNAVSVYAASKLLSEKAVWDFAKTKNPSFVVNTVIPFGTFGAALPGLKPHGTAIQLLELAAGRPSMLPVIGPGFHIDVFDVAKLHILCLTRDDVRNERIIAANEGYSINSMLDLIKKVKPNASLPERQQDWNKVDNTKYDVKRGQELLSDQGGFRSFEYSVRGHLENL